MSNIPLPIIEIELQRVRQHFSYMLNAHLDEYKDLFNTSVADFCKSDAFAAAINKNVREAITAGIATEVQAYFKYGDGQALIASYIASLFGSIVPGGKNV